MSGSLNPNPLLFFPSEFLNDAFQTMNVEHTAWWMRAARRICGPFMCFFFLALPRRVHPTSLWTCARNEWCQMEACRSLLISAAGDFHVEIMGKNHSHIGAIWDTLWWTNSLLLKMAIEIVDLPIKNGGSFHCYVSSPEGTQMGYRKNYAQVFSRLTQMGFVFILCFWRAQKTSGIGIGRSFSPRF